MKYVCIWKNASTNKETKKYEMPEMCQKKRCMGEFELDGERKLMIEGIRRYLCAHFLDIEEAKRERA